MPAYIARAALVAAIVTVATLIRLPVPTYRLYFNLGEAAVYTAALTAAPVVAVAGAAVGSAAADLLAGYPHWAAISFVVKGAEAYIVTRLRRRGPVAVLAGAALMIPSYAIAAYLFYGPGGALVELGGDFVQCGVGALVALWVSRRMGGLG